MLLPFASQRLVCLRSEDNAKIALKKIFAAIVSYIDEEAGYGIHLFIPRKTGSQRKGATIQTLAIRTSNPDPTHAPDLKQVQTYQVYHLEGTDSFFYFE